MVAITAERMLCRLPQTITPCFLDGRQTASCYCIVDNALSPAMAAHKQALFDHYYPIEINPDLTTEQKKPVRSTARSELPIYAKVTKL